MSLVKKKFILKFIFFLSIFALCSAYFIQYVLNHQPCNLCLIERIPYFSAAILIPVTLILNKYEKLISLIIALSFIFGSLISFYHVGIEQGFVKDPNKKISDLLKENNATILGFTRFEVGEGIEVEKVDFATEVMAQIEG